MQNKVKKISYITSLKGKMRDFSMKITCFIKGNDVELTMIIGLFFISLATYKVNFIAFLYILGLIFIAFSIYLLKYPSRGGDE